MNDKSFFKSLSAEDQAGAAIVIACNLFGIVFLSIFLFVMIFNGVSGSLILASCLASLPLLVTLIAYISWHKEFPDNCVIVPVYVEKKYFVAAAKQEYRVSEQKYRANELYPWARQKKQLIQSAVFHQVELKEEDYKKAFKGTK